MSEIKIKLLSPELVNQIAAGEVVERPASVVKELVENSIDAGAKNIRIDIENGGLNLIKITDDGCGMSRPDAENSIVQHATSKIADENDLANILTLGFRGEALASISSVSRFYLITKDKDSLAGTKLTYGENGLNIEDSSASQGTVISVQDLFYNVPARRKYLKTAVTEFNHIADLFFEYSLAYPEIGWKLSHNNKLIYQFAGADIFQRVGDVLGDEVAKNLIRIDLKLNDILIQGFIGKPQIARNNRNLQYLYINKRPVREFIISKQIKDAFGTLIPRDLYPVFILNLEVGNDRVDVNVHPRKLEVRFSEPQLIYKTVYQVVSRTLDESQLAVKISLAGRSFTPIAAVIQGKKIEAKDPQPQMQAPRMNFPFGGARPALSPQRSLDSFREMQILKEERDSEIMGQVDNAYIVVKTKTGIKIYDQHATSERIQYEKIKAEYEKIGIIKQPLLIPERLELTQSEASLVTENLEFFKRLGFGISVFSSNTIVIEEVPSFLKKQDLRAVILELLGQIERNFSSEVNIDKQDRILKIKACRSAIKFGDPLSLQGMDALIRDLAAVNGYTCVHGRPCFIEFSFDELEKLFKRK